MTMRYIAPHNSGQCFHYELGNAGRELIASVMPPNQTLPADCLQNHKSLPLSRGCLLSVQYSQYSGVWGEVCEVVCPPISILLFRPATLSTFHQGLSLPGLVSPDTDIRQMRPPRVSGGACYKYTLRSPSINNQPCLAHSHQSGTHEDFCNVMLDHQYLIFCQNVLNILHAAQWAAQTQPGPGSQGQE